MAYDRCFVDHTAIHRGSVKDRLSHMTVNLAVEFVLMVPTSPGIKPKLPGTLHTIFTLLSDLTHPFM